MLSLALSLILAQSTPVTCHRYESATEIVTVCAKRTDGPKSAAARPLRWIWVFVADVVDGQAEVVDCRSDERWTVPAWMVGGPVNIGHNVKIFTRKGA